jgi:hypothetical protein
MHCGSMALGRAACLRALRFKRVAAARRNAAWAASAARSRRGPAPAACLHHAASDAPGSPYTITTPLYYVNAGEHAEERAAGVRRRRRWWPIACAAAARCGAPASSLEQRRQREAPARDNKRCSGAPMLPRAVRFASDINLAPRPPLG